MNAPVPTAAPLVVYYDGACPLCRREIAWLQRLDRRGALRWVDVAPAGAACPLDRGRLLERFHVQADGEWLSGAAAFAAVWRAIPLLRPLGLLARWPWVLAALERAYGGFLRLRPRLQAWLRRRAGA